LVAISSIIIDNLLTDIKEKILIFSWNLSNYQMYFGLKAHLFPVSRVACHDPDKASGAAILTRRNANRYHGVPVAFGATSTPTGSPLHCLKSRWAKSWRDFLQTCQS
jgi:hypothetical protein